MTCHGHSPVRAHAGAREMHNSVTPGLEAAEHQLNALTDSTRVAFWEVQKVSPQACTCIIISYSLRSVTKGILGKLMC